MTVVPYSKDDEGNWVSKPEKGGKIFKPGILEHAAFELAVELKRKNLKFD